MVDAGGWASDIVAEEKKPLLYYSHLQKTLTVLQALAKMS
jgi:hypothetical protein